MKTADILLFDGVEVLDFAAPFEILTLAGTKLRPGSIAVRTVGVGTTIVCRNGLEVRPAAVFEPTHAPDWLIVPGGPGVEPLMAEKPWVIEAVASVGARASFVMSIGSGALLLAKAGLLRHKHASTHHSDIEALRQLEPSVRIEHGNRVVRDGNVISSDGISAALDASLFLVATALDAELAQRTAEWAEYHSNAWLPDIPSER
ncbi:MAG TPA: DJ-1/PfpI family protein [Polyangiaceae bacterium]|nr:DJ-1/PfpI family protein [Polyangiaceae bacterium]